MCNFGKNVEKFLFFYGFYMVVGILLALLSFSTFFYSAKLIEVTRQNQKLQAQIQIFQKYDHSLKAELMVSQIAQQMRSAESMHYSLYHKKQLLEKEDFPKKDQVLKHLKDALGKMDLVLNHDIDNNGKR